MGDLTIGDIHALLRRLDGEPADAIESVQLDCKEWPKDQERANQKTLRETAVCLANGRGGTIVLGVADRRKTRADALVGVPSDLDVDHLKKLVYDGTDPSITVEIEELIESGARLLLVHVPRGTPVHTTTEGVAKIRIGKDCQPLTGSVIARLLAPGPDHSALARRRVFTTAVGLLRGTAGESFRTSDGASSMLPGALWYRRRPDWVKIAERFGEFDRQRGRFHPFVEPALFDGSDDALAQAAAETMRLYVWSSENHPDFAAIRRQFGLPDPEQVKALIAEFEAAGE
jgi:hypothetical protein